MPPRLVLFSGDRVLRVFFILLTVTCEEIWQIVGFGPHVIRRIVPTSRSTIRSGSGNQPVSASRRSASCAMSPFFRWSISCADRSPAPSLTASMMRGLVTRPR